MKLELFAFAKINLSLVVLGRRPDGYHELDTLFQTVDLSDRLTFEPSEDLRLSCTDPTLPAGEGNLVLRAGEALRRRFQVGRGAKISLEKNIPHGAGLGGGSSDAAVTLMALAFLWGLPATAADLHELALALGSDVPYFLIGGRARGRGRGELLNPLPDEPERGVVLLIPPFPLSTPEVFRALGAPSLTVPPENRNLRVPDPGEFPDRNDLEPAAESLRGEVRRLREALEGAGARVARLSGSGSTVFGLFDDLSAARQAGSRMSGLPDGTRVEVVRTIPRPEYARRAFPGAAMRTV